ncbi:uncharacterized protein A4U43_C08F27780 [Asparagus officinalis]|uniref:uncharacterized protein LOC109822920 n=1 Tax=Asparagus officinalis TaxID=4686 RepID=UPI00098E56E0|nr:uncharacterized protein LOC109822920 [Asparagus officinalis]ONK61252.1 uncharacterized protein A4U43_C08F27780 [Asparagus officinalis]
MTLTMGDENTAKVTGIRHIVRLREMLHKWHSVTLGHKSDRGAVSAVAISPVINRRLKSLSINWESDDEGGQSPEPPVDVPKGYIPVYVGIERRRFVIPTAYLGLPVFKLLLEKAEEEFGFDHEGALTIPCEIETFKYILQVMEQHQKGLIDDEGNPTGLEE